MQKMIAEYLNFVSQRSHSSKTLGTYKQALKTFAEIVGNYAQLTKETYIKFLRKSSGMNPSTQAICRSAIKGLYFFQADNDPAITTAFFKQTDRQYALKQPKRLPVFDKESIEKVIDRCEAMRSNIAELRDRAFVLLLADTGLRISEACGLSIGAISWTEAKAVVIGKGNKQAIIHISNRAIGAMRDYLKERGNPPKSSPIFIRHDKRVGKNIRPVTAGGMWGAIKQRAVEAGVDPKSFRIHDFRHYFVTVVYSASGNIRLAQDLARHESIETTGRYTHLIDDSGKAYNDIFNKRCK